MTNLSPADLFGGRNRPVGVGLNLSPDVVLESARVALASVPRPKAIASVKQATNTRFKAVGEVLGPPALVTNQAPRVE